MHPIVKEFEERIGRELKTREKGVLGELLDKHIALAKAKNNNGDDQ